MDEATAFDLVGKTVSLIIDGGREDGVLVIGHNVSTHSPTSIDLLLRTRIGEPEKRIRVPMDKVELAP